MFARLRSLDVQRLHGWHDARAPGLIRMMRHRQDDDALRQGFDPRDIEPVYQPIVDLRDGHVVGYEALARANDGSGTATAATLFDSARAAGMVDELDRACREAALEGARVAGLGAPFALFVNADGRALEDDLPGIAPAGPTFVLDVTERALIERPEPLLRALTELRTRGWGISLDDVGAD